MAIVDAQVLHVQHAPLAELVWDDEWGLAPGQIL